jgi:hypothetical protein
MLCFESDPFTKKSTHYEQCNNLDKLACRTHNVTGNAADTSFEKKTEQHCKTTDDRQQAYQVIYAPIKTTADIPITGRSLLQSADVQQYLQCSMVTKRKKITASGMDLTI